jgi:hypothetical protein
MSFFIQKIVEHKEKFNNDELAKIRSGPVLSGQAGPEPNRLQLWINDNLWQSKESEQSKIQLYPLDQINVSIDKKIYLYLLLLLFYHRTKY